LNLLPFSEKKKNNNNRGGGGQGGNPLHPAKISGVLHVESQNLKIDNASFLIFQKILI
jgi:hypothetical protein